MLKTGGANIDFDLNNLRSSLIKTLTEPIKVIFHHSEEANVIQILDDINSKIDMLTMLVGRKLLPVFFSEDAEENVNQWLDTLASYKKLEFSIDTGNKNKILQSSIALANEVNQEFGRLVGEVAQKVRDAERLVNSKDALIQSGRRTLTNFRSVWEEFTAPGMGLNRHTVALIVKSDWKDREQRLSLTPSIARVKQIEDDLEGLGLRLPIVAVTERLLPAKAGWGMDNALISKFDFSNLLSDLAGMRFDKLFPGFKMPGFARDKIRVTHSFDKKNLSAWIKAEADVRVAERKKLMSIGLAEVVLENGLFTGEISLRAVDDNMTRTNSGRLDGSWHLNIAGIPLMIFRDTSITFNDNKFAFDIDPRRMEMPGLLKMLTDATTRLVDIGAVSSTDENGNKKDVFAVAPLKVNGQPVGVRAALDIPPINVGGGLAGISNLCFGCHFELRALNDSLQPHFLLSIGFYLGRREAPFNITILFLGGGGYVSYNLIFEPNRGLSVSFALSIYVSAGLSLALGPLSGLVLVMLGGEGGYHKTPDKSGGAYITFYFRILGRVEVLGIVSVFLYLGLEATYRMLSNGGSEVVGTGFIQLEIRICAFFKIRIRKSYTKRLAGSGGGLKKFAYSMALSPGDAQSLNKKKAENILNSLA